MRHPYLRRLLMAAVFASALASPAMGQAPIDPALESGVRDMLDASARAWWAGDLDAFMKVYVEAPQTRYRSQGRDVLGHAAIREMYAGRFGGIPGQLGRLSFDVLELRPLGAEHALLVGRYHLQPPQAEADPATGQVTLILRRMGGQWRIEVDHTS
ncbi:MAG: DUF4440 domain-containing protein [Pigmentiphaga sp.]|nr:DUF4440 domain-containing protein [Pigmentiphaga sp.]